MSSFWDAAALLFLWYRDDDVKQILLQNQAAMGPSENWGPALVGTISFVLWVARISARFPFLEEPEGNIGLRVIEKVWRGATDTRPFCSG